MTYIEMPKAELPLTDGWYFLKLLRFKTWTDHACNLGYAYFHDGKWYTTYREGGYQERDEYTTPFTHWLAPTRKE